jgi:hypothetical protein
MSHTLARVLRRTLIAGFVLAWALVALSLWSLGNPARAARTAADAAADRWEQARPHHYRIRVRMISLDSGESLVLEVRDEQLVGGWAQGSAQSLSADELRQVRGYLPVRAMLALARHEAERHDWRGPLAQQWPQLAPLLGLACHPRATPPTTYDQRLGFPTRLFISGALCGGAGSVDLRIDELTLLP